MMRLRRIRLLAAPALAAAGILGVPLHAAANPPGPHDPIGAVTSVKAVPGGIQFTGWAADPDALQSNDTVFVIVDGRSRVASTTTSVPNATVQAKYGTGPTPGFTLLAPIDNTQSHTACLVAGNIGSGMSTLLSCVPTPLGSTLTATQLAAHNPIGAIQSVSISSTSYRFQGWSSDPDYYARRATVVLYVDGSPAATVATHSYPSPRPAGAGVNSAFDITVPVSTGMHIGCIWVVNVGLGTGNALLGCRARDTRGPAGTGTITVPKLNTQVVTEAKTHIGQAYVWGAAGPTSFDCSGLVKYSYGKFGFTTPRTSEQQALAARLIPASRAVPGDLVFYHDTEGDVYHVGIYVSPGLTVAAIDTAQGVNYQKIWDPSSATYGSFTHI
jgi:cell wall-associated NlpC family hydrolase